MRRIAVLFCIVAVAAMAVVVVRRHGRVERGDLKPESANDSSEIEALRAEIAQTKAIALLAASRASAAGAGAPKDVSATAPSAGSTDTPAKADPPPPTIE